MQYNYVTLRPDRLNYPTDVFPVGRFSSAVLVFVGDVPADIASMKVLVGRTNDPLTGDPRSDFTIDAVRGDDGVFRAYMPPTCFPDVAELEYHVHGTDTSGNDRWLGTGPLRVVPGLTNAEGALPPPDTLPGYVRSFNGKTGAVTLVATDILTAGPNITIAPDGTISAKNPDVIGKLDGAATYDAWDQPREYSIGDVVSYKGFIYRCINEGNRGIPPDGEYGLNVWTQIRISELLGEKQGALSSAQLAAVNSGATAAKVATWDGYAAQIAQKANAADLPYAMVTPGEWEFSDGVAHEITGPLQTYVPETDSDYWVYESGGYSSQRFDSEELAISTLFISFENMSGYKFTATRASLPGHLLDRANNLIDATTGNVTLTLPPFVAGKVRDLLVACTIGLDGNDEPWSVIFQGDDGEEISFKAEGDDAASATFPVPDAAGDWWYSLTERAPHVFAVSLKQLQSVSQMQTQGGS